ncbi:MAG: DnaJ domain-containing protein [Candidatus Paracaedimonas acanthamoebae]|uniref:DnaJ domain-containing protein n=1 Tax=Candidatus Paracaedimonas acanthamoebae TaxID=244581 RepID=A0A8J7TVU8_9PROT|nr:DnaJ domain-containing protein [Candidatus Paracaedimonas acanthamoebae]
MKTTYKLHPFFEDPQPQKRICDESGCLEEALYKAPQSPQQLQIYYWFCLKHIQIYNSQWNYYRDMGTDEIEDHYRSDITWQRPSWRFGSDASKTSFFIKDPFDLLDRDHKNSKQQQQESSWNSLSTEEANALKLMELNGPVTGETLKQKYIQLVKIYHPDVNNGCAEAEEKLKLINKAYGVLKKVIR